ncbi:MAG: aldo/keto reductase [Desulfotignum sp.]|nr:aldo/keto reductase [Desulfotignum sp.]MCF8113767.1 aldo/keto reductase [Desulfotignum sp.]MCF8125914.1 aldo/keto reductase [Desulfotignum sp.]
MEYRTLGKKELQVSALGLGCWGMSHAYGRADTTLSVKTIHQALDRGINFFDTADVYGAGGNELLLGRALKDRRQKAVVATKFGFVGDEHGDLVVDGRPEYVKTACEQSLKRLGTDHIDLYYLHRLDPRVPVADTVGAMAQLAAAGKIRCIGLSEVSVTILEQAHAVHPVTALQSEYSLFERSVESNVLPVCRKLGIGFVPFSPLGRGMLTTSMNKHTCFEKKDYRLDLPRFQKDNFVKNMGVKKTLDDFAGQKGVSVSQIALAWLLAKGRQVVPIPGMKTARYLDENLGALDLELSQKEMAFLDQATCTVYGNRHNASNLKFIQI